MKLVAMLGCFTVVLGVTQAEAQPPPAQQACFFISEFRGWKAPDDKTIFIRVGTNRFYRLDLAASCPALKFPDAHLITRSRGPETICSALDWDLQVAQLPPISTPEPCIVKTMTLLPPDEAAAIPARFKP